MPLIQIVAIAGALMILAAYAANQLGRLSARTLTYAAVNAVGAAVLAVVAGVEEQWGFLLLEAAWSLVALVAVVRLLAARGAAS